MRETLYYTVITKMKVYEENFIADRVHANSLIIVSIHHI